MHAPADRLLSTEALAEYLGVPIKTVYTWNSEGSGPRRIRVGKHVRYRRSDVDAWLDARAIDPSRA